MLPRSPVCSKMRPAVFLVFVFPFCSFPQSPKHQLATKKFNYCGHCGVNYPEVVRLIFSAVVCGGYSGNDRCPANHKSGSAERIASLSLCTHSLNKSICHSPFTSHPPPANLNPTHQAGTSKSTQPVLEILSLPHLLTQLPACLSYCSRSFCTLVLQVPAWWVGLRLAGGG